MRWNEEEIKFLKENYSHTDDMVLSNKLNRSVYSIRTKANKRLKLKKYKECLGCGEDITNLLNAQRCRLCSKLHIKEYKTERYLSYARINGVKPKNLWNEKEIVYLKQNYPFIRDEVIADELGRSVNAIRTKAKLLALAKIRFCRLCKVDITNLSNNAIVCKSCVGDYRKGYKQEWTIKNKERVSKNLKKWTLNNKDYKREYSKLWRLKNKEKKRLLDKLYYQKIKALKREPICITCGKVLIGKNHNTKWCRECSRHHKYEYTKMHRKRNIEYYRGLVRNYRKRKREEENQKRIKLGLPPIGSYFKKEQELLFYVKNLFPNEKVIYHDRSTLGNGWELDIFIPALNLAFEYYGRQHFEYKSTFYWKDYEEFKEQQLRDKIKRILCRIKNITLIEFACYEQLSEQLVLTKLYELGVVPNQSNLVVYDRTLGSKIKMQKKQEELKW